MQKEKYFYSVKLNVKCESCDNQYIRVDNFPNSDKKTKKYFDEFYEDNEVEEIDECNKCGLCMFPDEIINITEHKQIDYLENLKLYINSEYRIIPTNTMQLIGITLEGVNEDSKKEAIVMDLTEENYKKIWQRGKDLFVNGDVSKYLICFLENDKCFAYARPDQYNFEKYIRMDNYMKYDTTLKSFDKYPKNFFLISSTKEDLFKKYEVEEELTDIPSIDRSNTLEIS